MLDYNVIKGFFAKYGDVLTLEFQMLQSIDCISYAAELYEVKKQNKVKKMLIELDTNKYIYNLNGQMTLPQLRSSHGEIMDITTGAYSGYSYTNPDGNIITSQGLSYFTKNEVILNPLGFKLNGRQIGNRAFYRVFDEAEITDISGIDQANTVEVTAYYQ